MTGSVLSCQTLRLAKTRMNALLETAVDTEPALLQRRLAEEGYVFVRRLLDPGLVWKQAAPDCSVKA